MAACRASGARFVRGKGGNHARCAPGRGKPPSSPRHLPNGEQPWVRWKGEDARHPLLVPRLERGMVLPGSKLALQIFVLPRFPSRQARRLNKKRAARSEEQTSELQSLMRISYAVF